MREIHQFVTKEGRILEYSVAGIGRPVLVLHGGHSNCLEEFGYDVLIKKGYSLITPSRPGYGATSPQIGSSLKEVCETLIELLDHLGLQRVHLLAISAGGPSGLLLASRFPDRAASLTLQSAITKEWLTPKDIEYQVAQLLFRPGAERVTWKLIGFMNQLFPRFLFRQMAPSFSALRYSEIKTYEIAGDMPAFGKMISRQRSGRGFLIDLAQTKEITPSDLETIQCPVLILHSRHDKSVPIHHARYASMHIPFVTLKELDTWGHLIWLGRGSETMNRELLAFLNSHNSSLR